MLFRYEQVEKHRVKIHRPQANRHFEEGYLLRLGDSLRDGQLQPIGLLADCSLIWGEGRVRAALLKDQITHLWAAIFEEAVSEAEFLRMRAVENFQRLDLTAYQRWQTLEELRRAQPDQKAVDLAEYLHLDASLVSKILSLSRCIPAVQELAAAGALGITEWNAFAKESAQRQHELLAMRLEGKLTGRDALESHRRKARNGTPAVRVSRVKCPVPGRKAVVQISGEGISLDDMIEAMQELLKEARKASERGLDCKTFERVCRDLAKKGC